MMVVKLLSLISVMVVYGGFVVEIFLGPATPLTARWSTCGTCLPISSGCVLETHPGNGTCSVGESRLHELKGL